MVTAQSLLNSFVFWSAWIIIPVIVEIIPSIASVFVLIKRRLKGGDANVELSYAPDISLVIPVYNSANSLEACLASVDKSTYPNERIEIFRWTTAARTTALRCIPAAKSASPTSICSG